MKVLFVYPNIVDSARKIGAYHMGIGYLSAVLKKNGHRASVFNIYKQINERTFIERIVNETPDLIAFSATSHMFPYVKQFCGWLLQNNLKFKTICGGIHATLSPQEVIETNGLDMLCIGEGEAALLELCTKLELKKNIDGIRNLWFKTDKGIQKNPVGPLIENLDELPFPDREIFDPHELVRESNGILPVSASRGCPYECTYCCNHAIKNIYPNKEKYVRFRSAENIILEIKEVLKPRSFIKSIAFEDDILFLKKDWSKSLVSLYKNEINIPFSCGMRPELITDEVALLLASAGCSKVCIGIESGSAHIRNQVLNRRIQDEHIRKAFRFCKANGIEVFAFNIVGIPFEKPGDILQTIKLNSEVLPDSYQVSIFYPYPGTHLQRICQNEGFIVNRRVDDYFTDSKLELHSTSRMQVLMFHRYSIFFVKLYSKLNRLPHVYSKVCISIVDHILKNMAAAYCLYAVYVATKVVYRILFSIVPLQKLLRKITGNTI